MTGVGTIWRGSAFNCSSSGNEIFLRFRSDSLGRSDTRTCNDGMITGRVVDTDGDYYTSQLNVTLDHDVIGETIECNSIDGKQNPAVINRVGGAVINLCTYMYVCFTARL